MLEGTGSYPDVLGRNQRSVAPGVQDPNSSPQAFRQVGGWSQ
jgi:hypothetical protein